MTAAWRHGLLGYPVICRQYKHGGARFYVRDDNGRERLVADTYFAQATDRLIEALDAEVEDA